MCSDVRPAKRRYALVTGCFRSGTTLLEKLLHQHRDACFASQPLPHLYYFVKERFLADRGLAQRYPLNHQFCQSGYAPADWFDYLTRVHLTSQDLAAVRARLQQHADAVWTPQILADDWAWVQPGTFSSAYGQFMDFLAETLGRPAARLAGSKEVICEEFVPYLLSEGIHVVLIVRDPRDVAASVHFSTREHPLGAQRPLLFTVRAWRKSVAYALAWEGHPQFSWLRYEDLVRDHGAVLDRLAASLELGDWSSASTAAGIRDQQGRAWEGNSSFVASRPAVSAEAVGQFAERLPDETLDYLETMCLPEMTALDYLPVGSAPRSPRYWRQFGEPFPVDHRLFPPDYSRSTAHLESERYRLELLSPAAKPLDARSAETWFVHPRAYARLREAVAAHGIRSR